MGTDSAKNGISSFGDTSWQYKAAIKELAGAAHVNAAAIDEQRLRLEYTSFTGKVFFPGSPEEIEYAERLAHFARTFINPPQDMTAAFRLFLDNPDFHSRESGPGEQRFKNSVAEAFRIIAENFEKKASKLRGPKNEARKNWLLLVAGEARRVVSVMQETELRRQDFYTLKDVAEFIASPGSHNIGMGLLHLSASDTGIHIPFKTYLTALTSQAKTFDPAAWRRALEPVMRKLARDNTPRFQDMWLASIRIVGRTQMNIRYIEKKLTGLLTREMLAQGIPSENDALHARNNSMLTLLNEGEHDLVSRLLDYGRSRKTTRGLLDAITHAAMLQPLSTMGRQLVLAALRELEFLTEFEKPDYKNDLWNTGARIWSLIRPLLERGERKRMPSFDSMDAYLEDYYRRRGGRPAPAAGGASTPGMRGAPFNYMMPQMAGISTMQIGAQAAMGFTPFISSMPTAHFAVM